MDLAMKDSKSIMDQIRTFLREGKTPKEIIELGYAKSTTYAVAKKINKEATVDLQKLARRVDYLWNYLFGWLDVEDDMRCPECGHEMVKVLPGHIPSWVKAKARENIKKARMCLWVCSNKNCRFFSDIGFINDCEVDENGNVMDIDTGLSIFAEQLRQEY
jgi:hypothetical protein